MTNLLIGFPQVQQAAVRGIAAATFSGTANENALYPMINAGRGWRNQYFKASAAASSVYLNWDLGASAWAATPPTAAQINAVIMSRFDLIKNLASTISLKVQGSNDDFSTSTDLVSVADIDAQTLKGPWANDWISTFSTSAAFRYFRLNLTKTAGADITPALGKVYFCQMLDLGVEPNEYSVERLVSRTPFVADSGAEHPAAYSTPRFKVDLTWELVSDTNTALFMNNISAKRLDTSFFLYTSTYHDPLGNQQLLHVRCTEAATWNPSEKADKNTISASFEEVLG